MTQENTPTTAELDVPPSILVALLDAADEILGDVNWLLRKWSVPVPVPDPMPSWDAQERLREAFARYPWPARIGGG